MSTLESVSKPEAVKEMYLELVDTGDSGYVLDGSENTPFKETINCAGLAYVPSTGKMSVEIKDDNGKGTGRYRNVSIRYIKDCPYIDVEEQKKFGWDKSKIPSVDAIQIFKGKTLIKREGDVALFDYLEKVFYNQTAVGRPKTAKAIFKVVSVIGKVDEVNEGEFLKAKAISYVSSLAVQKGKGQYSFKEAKIDNILTMLKLFGGDNYSEKINVLTVAAKKNPKDFLDAVTALEQVTLTEVSHALELNVIKFDGKSVQYVGDNKVLATLSEDANTQPKKIGEFSGMLQTPEFAAVYQELKAKIELAKDAQLKK